MGLGPVGERRAIEPDYDSNPERFRVGSAAASKFGTGDVHDLIADRLAQEALTPVLDVGCGNGRLAKPLVERGVEWVGLDASMTMLSALQGKRILGDATSLPVADGSFACVAALYMLYHLAEPERALVEARRVLQKGGLFVTAVPSRHTDPELAGVIPQRASTFDAEIAPTLSARYFGGVEVQTWDGPLATLPDRSSVAEYLFGRGLPRDRSEAVARDISVPLTLTKRGCIVWGRCDG